jgi:hydroxymethylbilane synthase
MLTIGSRGSALALWQARWIAARLAALGHETRVEVIRTTGDRLTGVPLAQAGAGKGVFTKEIEEALLAGRIDVAVHSLKDLPTELPAGLALAAVPGRDDVRDALVGQPLAALPAGARVGTGSLRRGAQLRALRPDLRIEPVRGNVDTRLRKLDAGEYDALVLAAAGLRRLGWEERIAEYFPAEVMLPAPGQGALAVETRAGSGAEAICAAVEDPASRAAVEAERALLAGLGGGCQVPIGAWARPAGGGLRLSAVVLSPDGTTAVRGNVDGAEPHALGAELARQLLRDGAGELLA